MSGFTPGPWLCEGRLVYALEDTGQFHRGKPVLRNRFDAHVQGSHTPADELEANARLIAAAPDLLAALRDMREGWRYIRQHHGDLYGVGWDRAEQAADAAMAKATGGAS